MWTWEGAQLYLDVGERVRVLVQSVEFKEVRPGAAKRPSSSQANGGAPPSDAPGSTQPGPDDAERNQAPFQVVGDMSGTGLGPLTWWAHAE